MKPVTSARKDRSRARFKDEHFRLIREAGFQHVRINIHPLRDARPGETDLLIASVALTNGQTVITRNVKHFPGIPGLSVESH